MDSNLLFLIVASVSILLLYRVFGIIASMAAAALIISYVMYLKAGPKQISDPRLSRIAGYSPKYFTPESL